MSTRFSLYWWKIIYNTAKAYGYSPFYRNTSLYIVVISDREEQIYENEFYGCSNLKNVRIGNDVTSIGNWAFSGCSSLNYFTFGNKVSSIGEEAFSDCINLMQLVSHAIVPPICGTQALDDINKWNCKLYVPSGNIKDYQSANQWMDFFFMNEIPTAIDDIEATTEIMVSDNGIVLTACECENIVIYTANGSLVEKIDCYAGEEIALDKGVYIVRVGEKSIKLKL